jgi:hypothetical protein
LISRRVLIALGAILSVGIGGIFVIGASEASRLSAKSERLARAASFDRTRESPDQRRTRLAEELDELGSDDVTLEVPELAAIPRGRLALVELGGDLSDVSRVELELSDISAEVTGEAASVKARVRSLIVSGGIERRDQRPVTLRWTRRAGRWRVTSIEVAPRSHEEPEARP